MDLTSTPARHVHAFYVTLILVCAIFATVFVVYIIGARWYYEDYNLQLAEPFPVRSMFMRASAEVPGIGAEIYDRTANPLQDRLPDVTPNVQNPIDGMYTNPFE